MSKHGLAALLLSMAAIGLAGCGGGSDDDEDEDEGPPDASGAGIWIGTHRIDGQTANQPMFGIVTEEADYAMLSINGTTPRLFFGTGSTIGNSFNANAVTYLGPVRSAPASMQGTINENVSISGSYSLTGESAVFNLTYQAAQYNRPASLAVLQGVYSATSTNGMANIALTVEANGTLTTTYSAGCTYTGTVTVPHPDRNYYRANVTFSGCGAANGPASLLMFLQDIAPGQNNQLVVFEQHQTQTNASVVVVRK